MPPRSGSPTHFLSIHLAGPQLSRTLASFRADVTSLDNIAPLPPAAIRPLGTMHLTLGVMNLSEATSLQTARDVLRRCGLASHLAAARRSTAPEEEEGKLTVTLKGLQALRDPARTTVVYIPPHDPAGTLYAFCERVRDDFRAAGLMAADERPLLLHATVVNTIYVPGQRKMRGNGGGRGKLEVDARGMIGGYEGCVWAEGMEVEGVRLCEMSAKKVEGGEDERYVVVDEVRF